MNIVTPIKSIRAKCVECCCGNKKEVSLCNIVKCPLHPCRFGKRPKNAAENICQDTKKAPP